MLETPTSPRIYLKWWTIRLHRSLPLSWSHKIANQANHQVQTQDLKKNRKISKPKFLKIWWTKDALLTQAAQETETVPSKTLTKRMSEKWDSIVTASKDSLERLVSSTQLNRNNCSQSSLKELNQWLLSISLTSLIPQRESNNHNSTLKTCSSCHKTNWPQAMISEIWPNPFTRTWKPSQ